MGFDEDGHVGSDGNAIRRTNAHKIEKYENTFKHTSDCKEAYNMKRAMICKEFTKLEMNLQALFQFTAGAVTAFVHLLTATVWESIMLRSLNRRKNHVLGCTNVFGAHFISNKKLTYFSLFLMIGNAF